MRFLFMIFLTVCVVGCACRHGESRPAATIVHPAPVNPADWGPAYRAGMEFGPPALNLEIAFGQAEAFLAKQPFASRYAKRACSGAGERFVDVDFALLSDVTGKTLGTVRVDTASGECVWLGNTK